MLAPPPHDMEVLSPRSANLPTKTKATMKKSTKEVKPKLEEKPTNPDRIDDKWRPPIAVTEPGNNPQTYVVGKKLGKGGFAVCFEGKTQSTSELFALKVVKAKVEQKKMMEKFRTEMQIHAKMQHPNIVEFYRAFTLDQHTYVILELCDNGSLTDMVKARSCLSLPEVRRFMIQICGGVKYMHKRNVIHRDLKMGNIFLDAQMNIKIGDFGLAAVMADEQDRRTTLCGTPNYIAPEILSKSGARGHDSKVDTWAIGIIAYAMLVGIPPFQSKTQQEIYSKLKTLDYEWKIDSKNYIPQQAKDFVAACLNLVAAERPEMDDLVEHSFFTMGAIADVLDRNCLKANPIWLENADPRGDRVKPGYGARYSAICSQCGVGRTADGKPRPAAGTKGNLSALMEIEAENRQGCAPVTPLPEGILYRQFTDPEPERPAFQKSIPIPSRPRGKKPMEEAREIISGVSANATQIQPTRQISAARPVQSFAAQQRQQALPTRAVVRSRIAEEPALPKQGPADEDKKFGENMGLLKARPVRATSVRSTRNVPISDKAVPKSNTLPCGIDELSNRLLQEVDEVATSSGDRDSTTARSCAMDPTISRPRSTIADKDTAAIPRAIVLSSSSDLKSTAFQHMNENSGSVRQSRQGGVVPSVDPKEDVGVHEKLPPRSRFNFRPRMIEEGESYLKVRGTSHSHVMESLRSFHTSLGGIPQSSTKLTTSRARSRSKAAYPRVEKWVDYATKHGIAYLLTDGSLGMILKSKEDENISSSCVVVRNAKRHTELRARGREYQYVPQGKDASEVEFYEQVDLTEPMKCLNVAASKFKLDLEQHEGQSAAANALLARLRGCDAQRLKEVGLLDKFGKYMHKQMGSSDGIDQKSNEVVGHLIHFYQRLGNVGAWRFADGGIQFNFPDHTKLVIYQCHSNDGEPEIMVDLIYLEPRDAKDMAAYGVATHEALERRDLKTFQLGDIQQSVLRRSDQEIIRTNQILEKLDWIRAVIGCWIKEGGLGWTGDERLGWSGLQERREDKKIKLQWVTVGRPGGDADVAPN